jgi:hypothetical protein
MTIWAGQDATAIEHLIQTVRVQFLKRDGS